MEPFRVLAFDPGSRKAGYALLSFQKRGVECLDSGTMFFDVNVMFPQRLKDIFQQAENLLEKFKNENIRDIAIESLIYVKSPTALMKLAQARALILAPFLDRWSDSLFEYSPNLIKQTLTGHGHSDKQGVQNLLKHILQKEYFASDDESDALAVGWCHYCHLLQNPTQRTKKADIQARGLQKNRRQNSSLKDALSHLIR